MWNGQTVTQMLFWLFAHGTLLLLFSNIKKRRLVALSNKKKMLVTATWICNHGHKLWTSHTFRKIRVKNCSSKAHLLLALLWETKAAEYMFELCDAERCQLVLQKPHLNNMMNSSWDRVCRTVQIRGSPDKIQLKLLNLQTSLEKQKRSCMHAASFPTHEGRSFFLNNRHTHKASDGDPTPPPVWPMHHTFETRSYILA